MVSIPDPSRLITDDEFVTGKFLLKLAIKPVR
jgi:hypothetical protein